MNDRLENHTSYMSRLVLTFAMLVGFAFVSSPVLAQQEQPSGATEATMPTPNPAESLDQEAIVLESLRGLPYLTIEDTLRHKRELLGGAVEPLRPDVSLMFSSWEHALLREMKLQDATARPATQGEINTADDPNKPRIKGIRELSLGGIVFANAKDWTIWLNNQRVTPDAIPKEILDMRVTDAYVELKWFDSYTNLVYPLRLRPHQRFNLDNRIFLPGTTPGAL